MAQRNFQLFVCSEIGEALKGRKIIAQGNALGREMKRIIAPSIFVEKG